MLGLREPKACFSEVEKHRSSKIVCIWLYPKQIFLLHHHLQVVLHTGFFIVMKKKDKAENCISDKMKVSIFSLRNNLKVHEVRRKGALQRR